MGPLLSAGLVCISNHASAAATTLHTMSDAPAGRMFESRRLCMTEWRNRGRGECAVDRDGWWSLNGGKRGRVVVVVVVVVVLSLRQQCTCFALPRALRYQTHRRQLNAAIRSVSGDEMLGKGVA